MHHSTIEVAEDFYQALSDSTAGPKSLYQIVMGDFNAKVGAKIQQERCIGTFGLGMRKERGQMLVDYA